MSGVNIEYKGESIATIPDTGSKTIKTQGKYCEGDILVEYEAPPTPTPTLQSKSVTPTTSQQSVTPDSGYDGLSNVTVNATPLEAKTVTPTSQQQVVTPTAPNIGLSSVTVGAAPQPTLITKQITANGTYAAEDDNADGYSEVTVDVPVPTPVEEKDVNFFDYDGKLLYSYTRSEAASLSALPILPTHEGLTAQGWTHTLEQIQAFTESNRAFLEVGATYITDDGSTRIYFELIAQEQLNATISFAISGALTLEINWGDGSTVETISSSTTISHTFNVSSFPANILAKITPNGSGSFGLTFISSNFVISRAINRVEIGSNYPTLSNNQFSGFNNLKYITIPRGVITVGTSALNNCKSLKACVLPLGMETLAESVFVNCLNVQRIIMPESITSIGGYIFQNCGLLSLVIPSGVSIIQNSTISKNHSLKKLSLPDITQINNQGILNNDFCDFIVPTTVEQIGQNGLSGNGFVALEWPSRVTQMSNYVCSSNEMLMKINIPNTVTLIGNSAFFYCQSLLSVAIPNSVTSIGPSAFGSCTTLLTIDLSAYTDPTNLPTLVNYNAFPTNYGMKIYVADQAMLNAFLQATNWSRFSSYYRIKGA